MVPAEALEPSAARQVTLSFLYGLLCSMGVIRHAAEVCVQAAAASSQRRRSNELTHKASSAVPGASAQLPVAALIANENGTGRPASGSSVPRAQCHMPCLPRQTGGGGEATRCPLSALLFLRIVLSHLSLV